MKKAVLICVLITLTKIVNGQDFNLANQNNQAQIGAWSGGENTYQTSIKFTDNGTEREWFYRSWTTGVPSLGTYQKFSQILEKVDETFILVPMTGLNVLSHGDATFAYFNNDDLPDLFQTGIDQNGYSYTYVYMNNANSSWDVSQTLTGVIHSSIAVIADENGDGVVYMGKNTQTNSSITQIFKNDHQGSGHLNLIYDGPGGIEGSAHMVDIFGDNNFVPNVHGTNNFGTSFNLKIEQQSDGEYVPSSIGLPALENGKSFYYDWNQDGFDDWISAGIVKSFPGAPRLILIYLNDGNGNFTEHQRIPCGSNMRIALIDTDADGYKESLITMGSSWNGYEHDIVPFRNINGLLVEWENNPFDSQSTMNGYGPGFNNGFIKVTDMNNDGKDDVIIGGRATHSGAGWGNYKTQLYLNTTTTLSLQEDKILSSETNVYPNPTSNTISISLPIVTALNKFTVYDITGRTIITVKNTKHFNMSKYANGVYVLEFQTKDGRIGKKKFIKN